MPTGNARSAKQLGQSVPVVSGVAAERRGLKPSETARAIRRLYELHGIVPGRHTSATPTPSSETISEESPAAKSAEDVARDVGMHPKKAQVFNRLADLIPELMQLQDAGTIGDTGGLARLLEALR